MPARLAQQRTAFNAPVLAEWSQQCGCSSVVAAAWLQQRQKRLERGAHHVDVLDRHEGQLGVDVLRLVLIPLALRGIKLRVDTWTAVDDLKPLVERVGVGYRLQ